MIVLYMIGITLEAKLHVRHTNASLASLLIAMMPASRQLQDRSLPLQVVRMYFSP